MKLCNNVNCDLCTLRSSLVVYLEDLLKLHRVAVCVANIWLTNPSGRLERLCHSRSVFEQDSIEFFEHLNTLPPLILLHKQTLFQSIRFTFIHQRSNKQSRMNLLEWKLFPFSLSHHGAYSTWDAVRKWSFKWRSDQCRNEVGRNVNMFKNKWINNNPSYLCNNNLPNGHKSGDLWSSRTFEFFPFESIWIKCRFRQFRVIIFCIDDLKDAKMARRSETFAVCLTEEQLIASRKATCCVRAPEHLEKLSKYGEIWHPKDNCGFSGALHCQLRNNN